MLTIFLPLYILSIISLYIFFQSPEIVDRTINVASLMFAYASVQSVTRQNIPNATGFTLIDLLVYMEIGINLLYLIDSIEVRVQNATDNIQN